MRTFITLISLTFVLTSNSQDKISTFGKYYHLNGFGLQVPFGEPPTKTDPLENSELTSQEFRAFPPNEDKTAYAVAILNSKTLTNSADSVKELEYFAKINKLTAENVMKGKSISETQDVFKNKVCYKLKFIFHNDELNEDYYMTSLMFNHKTNVIKAYVITPVKNTNDKRINEFFESIILQDEVIKTDNNDESIYTVVPIMPQLGDNKEALQLYIQKNSKYPTSITKTATTKNVFVKVVIEKNGKVKFDKIMRGVDDKFDSEARRIVENMPNWTPGQFENGKTARTYMSFPIWFE